jgi:hypothetical protein
VSTPLIDPEPRSRPEILDALRERGDDLKVFEEELGIARDRLGEVLLEGFEQRLEMNWMAEAAGVSRQTAFKLLHKAQRRAAEAELHDKSERLAELRRIESRDAQQEAEYRRLRDDEDLNRWLGGDV